MRFKEESGILFVRLFAGEDFFEGLELACKGSECATAIVVSAVGMLSDFELGYFRKKGDYAKQFFKKPHELVALNGLILRDAKGYNFHLHAALSNEKKQLRGGHLFSAKVKITAEIVLLKSAIPLHRELEEETGLMGLKL
ncbi:MAG: DUF296 domain-containing protein [Candidatus Diapherotrites archaeon]